MNKKRAGSAGGFKQRKAEQKERRMNERQRNKN
jgi:hypothetical protein